MASCRVRAVRDGAPNDANMAPWSAISCSSPRGPDDERSAWLGSLAMTMTGDPLTKASPKAPSTFAAPGPEVSRARPGTPVARARPSAA